MKKIIVLSVFILWFVGLSFWTYTNTSNEWQAPVHNQGLNFQATYQNGSVQMTWNKFTPQSSNWQYYKVVRSTNKQQPYYPDDGYIQVIGDNNTTSYVDSNPPAWTVYYGVCAITQSNYGRYRNCDWQSVSVDGSVQEVIPVTTPNPTPIISNLSASLKLAVDVLINKLINNLEDKFGDDIDSKVDVLETISNKLSSTIVSYRVKPLISYLVMKLDEAISLLEVQSLLNID